MAVTDAGAAGSALMTEADLAARCRSKRKKQGLTQTELADRMVEAGRAESLSKQAISKAENYAPADGMTALRVALLEELTGRALSGPYWTFEDVLEVS